MSEKQREAGRQELFSLMRQEHGVTCMESELTDIEQCVLSYALSHAEGEAFGWFTEDHDTDKSATTYDPVVADRWREKGWPVWPLYTHPAPQVPAACTQCGRMTTALSHAEGEAVELDRYDAGVLGGTDDSPTCWWHDYIRSELDSAHDFYQQQVDGLTRPEPQRRAYTCDHQPDKETADRLGGAGAAFAAGCGGDDYEELGHYLLRTLAEEGFGVFELNTHPAPQVAGLTETAIKSSPAYRALHREKDHLLGLLKDQAPQVAVPEGFREKLEDLVAAAFYTSDMTSDKCKAGIEELMAMLAAAPTAPAGELRPDCSVCGDFGSDCDVCGTPYQQPVSDPDGKSKQAALQDEAGFTPQRLMESAPNGCWGQSEYVLRNYVDGILHSVDIGGHRFVLKQASPDPDERDRAVAGEQADRCIGAIDGMLDERKPWYSAQEMYDFLIRRDYSAQIASELSELWADSLNSARQRVLTENAPDEREIAALLERIVPRIDPQNPKPLDEIEHCCECTLYYERERIHGEIARLRKLGGNHD